MKAGEIIFVLLCFGIIAFFALRQKCNQVRHYVYRSKDGCHERTVLVVSSIHGAEPAGSMSAKQLKQKLDKHGLPPKWRGTLIMIPEANPCGLWMNLRIHPLWGTDMNRAYGEGGKTQINRSIMNLIDNYKVDFIVDQHEAWGLHSKDQGSMGQGIYPIGDEAWKIAKHSEDTINSLIKHQEFKYKSRDWFPVPPGSLREFAIAEKKNYILIESSVEQKLEKRVKQQELILFSILNKYMSR